MKPRSMERGRDSRKKQQKTLLDRSLCCVGATTINPTDPDKKEEEIFFSDEKER